MGLYTWLYNRAYRKIYGMPPKFLNEDEIYMDMMRKLQDDEKEYLRKLPASKLIMFHHTVGQHIRNEYELWHDANPHTTRGPLDDNHPDQMSMRIIERIHMAVNYGF